MKRILLIFMVLLFVGTTFAQMQQGIVKTPTRRNVNGTWTQGQYIVNATVGVRHAQNNAIQSFKSGKQGRFTFPVKSAYYITSVFANKGTYTFLDSDFSQTKRYYSQNAVEVLVDDPNVLANVRQEAIAYERGKIKKQIRAKEDEIEALKEENKLTLEEYNKLLDELDEFRRTSESVVHQIAEVYATTDFDNIDDFNQQLLTFVEEGNFVSADSLLRTKGSKEMQFLRIKESDAAIKKTKEELLLAEEYNAKDRESFAKRLYYEYLMFLQRPMMQDSALYCLKMRADLDSTNVLWNSQYANLCKRQHLYDEAIKYYQISAKLAQKAGRDDMAVSMLGQVATIHGLREQYADEYALLKDLIPRAELYEVENPDGIKSLGYLYWELGNYYQRQNNPELAVVYLKKCNEIGIPALGDNEVDKEYMRTESLAAIGSVYCNMFKPEDGLPYILHARELLDSIYVRFPNAKNPRYEANVERSLGLAYAVLQDYKNAVTHYLHAYDLQKELYMRNPGAYRPFFAETCMSLGVNYFYLGDKTNSLKYTEESAALFEELHQKDLQFLTTDYCDILNNIGYLNYLSGDNEKANEYFSKSQDILKPLYDQDPNIYAYHYVLVLINRFAVFRAQGDLEICRAMLDETENLAEVVYAAMKEVFSNSISIMYKEYARYYIMTGNKTQATLYFTKASSVLPNDPELTSLQEELNSI